MTTAIAPRARLDPRQASHSSAPGVQHRQSPPGSTLQTDLSATTQVQTPGEPGKLPGSPTANDRPARKNCRDGPLSPPPATPSTAAPPASPAPLAAPHTPDAHTPPRSGPAISCDPASHWLSAAVVPTSRTPLAPCTQAASLAGSSVTVARSDPLPRRLAPLPCSTPPDSSAPRLPPLNLSRPSPQHPPPPRAPEPPPPIPQHTPAAAPRSLPTRSDTLGSSPDCRCVPETLYSPPLATDPGLPSDTTVRPLLRTGRL